mgnify:CR=1 FL=1
MPPTARYLLLSLLASVLVFGDAEAEAPSNADLYKLLLQQQELLKQQQRQIEQLKARAERAEQKVVAKSVQPQSQVPRPPIVESPRRSGDELTASVSASAMTVSSQALVVVKGDDDTGDTVGSQEITPEIAPGFNARLAWAPARSRFSYGVGAKWWSASLEDNFNGVDIVPFIGVDRNRVNRMSVDMKIDRFIGDVDSTYDFLSNGEVDLGLLAGLRVAYFRTHAQYRTLERGVSDPTEEAETDSAALFYGFGPRFGLSSKLDLGNGFGLDGSGSASVLFGQTDIATRQAREAGVASDFRTTFVPIMDADLGLTYERSTADLMTRVRLAAQLEWWSNVPDHYRIHSSSAAESQPGKDYLFFGPSASVQMSW